MLFAEPEGNANYERGAGRADALRLPRPERPVGPLQQDGPRSGRLVDYINAKFDCEIDLVPIYCENPATILQDMRQTRIDVTMPAPQAVQLNSGNGDDWTTLLADTAALLDEGVISIRVSTGQKGKAAERADRAGRLRALMNQLRSRNDLKGFKSMKVHGTELATGNPLTVDLLEQRFILRAEVPSGPHGVAPDDARAVLIAEHRATSSF